MKDRNVEFPNRYKLSKIDGTDDIVELIPAPGEVEEEGDYFNKANMLQDATAEKYGLDNTAVPNGVSRAHWRSKTKLTERHRRSMAFVQW